MKKRGIFFSMDALLSFTIILIIVLLAFPLIKLDKYESPIARDILVTLSSLKMGELSNSYVQALILNGTLDPNKTALEQIGILTITDEAVAKVLTDIILQDIETKENIGIWYGNKIVYSSNKTAYENASNIFTERFIVSGLGGLNGTGILSGYSARAFLSNTYLTTYSYFGGYAGEGNITLTVEYNGTINDADLELASNKDFQIYINGVYAGNYTKSQSTTNPSEYELSSHISKFNSGNTTVFNGTTNGRQTITISNAQLSSQLDYNQLANKTTPIRLGLKNVSLIYTNNNLDISSVVDLSGSMQTNNKMNDAKNATNELIDTVLNISGNRVGLIGFEDYAKKPDFHNLSNSSQSLKNIVDNVWNANGYTCICCGILKATSCFDKEIFYDNFNDQTNGTTPLGWKISQWLAIASITTDSLEGNRATVLARTGPKDASITHTFNPQEDKVNVEFLVRHDTGTGRFRLDIAGLDNSNNYKNYIILKMYNGYIRNNDAEIVPYSLGASYKIRAEITPGTNTYNLYVNDSLVGSSLLTSSTYSSVARVSFQTETAAINYKVDAINVSLAEKLCDIQTGRSKEMIVMSDGEPNKACGLDLSPDWDGDSSTTNDPQDQAIEAACIAKAKYNITVHAIALDVNNGSLAEQTMQGIASCGDGGFYTSNISQLSEIYRQITRSILSNYNAQVFNSSAGQYTRLYPNSYISLNYPSIINPFGIIITIEKAFSNLTSINFDIPLKSTPVSLTAISYSGDQWTNRVILNNETVYNLSNYGADYIDLGDPYAIKIDPKKLLENNTLLITTASSASINETIQANNKVIYSISKNFSAFSPILA